MMRMIRELASKDNNPTPHLPTTNTLPITIVGAGIVGDLLALNLARQTHHQIHLIDSTNGTLPAITANQRPLVLSASTQQILKQQKLWPELQNASTKIKKIHISKHKRLGRIQLDVQEHGIEGFGYTINPILLSSTLKKHVAQETQITIHHDTNIETLTHQPTGNCLHGKQKNKDFKLNSALTIGADGSDSSIRQLIGATTYKNPKVSYAMISTLMLTASHNNSAYQRFAPWGPIGIIPNGEKTCTIVYSMDKAHKQQFEKLDAEKQQALLKKHCSNVLPSWTTMTAPSFTKIEPQYTKQLTGRNTLIIGNAANTLHPNTGQGLNHAIQDLERLVDKIKKTPFSRPISQELLESYAKESQARHQQLQFFTSLLAPIFANEFPPIAVSRHLTMLAIDNLPWLKNRFVKWILAQ